MLSEELGDVVRKWRSLGIDQMRDWELKAIDLETALKDAEAVVNGFKEQVGKLKFHLSPEGEYSITRSDGEPMSWESLTVSNIMLELDALLEDGNEIQNQDKAARSHTG